MGSLARHKPTPTPNPPATSSIRRERAYYLPEAYHAAVENMPLKDTITDLPTQPSQFFTLNSSSHLTETNPATRQFLKDIALVFSRQKTASRADLRTPSGSSYVTATMLGRLDPSEGEVSLTIYVAFNGVFGKFDSGFRDKLVKFLNTPPCRQENGEEKDVERLAIMATAHCFGRFSAYVRDAKAQCRDHPNLYTAFSHDIDDAQDVVNDQCFGCSTETSAEFCIQLLRSIESNIELLVDGDVSDKLKKCCKILRACRRIVRFRDGRSEALAGKFLIIGIQRKQPSNQRNHCEMKLVHEALCGNITPTFDYIGCTKLPCLPCWYTVNKGSRFTTEKTHWKIYGWDLVKSELASQEASMLEEAVTELVQWLPNKEQPAGRVDDLCPESPVDWDLCSCSGNWEKRNNSGCSDACLR